MVYTLLKSQCIISVTVLRCYNHGTVMHWIHDAVVDRCNWLRRSDAAAVLDDDCVIYTVRERQIQ